MTISFLTPNSSGYLPVKASLLVNFLKSVEIIPFWYYIKTKNGFAEILLSYLYYFSEMPLLLPLKILKILLKYINEETGKL